MSVILSAPACSVCEHAELAAIVEAITMLLDRPGHITRAEVLAALRA